MERVPQLVRRGKKDRRMGAPSELDWEAIEALRTEMRVELIQELIPLGLAEVGRVLDEEVERLAGPRHARKGEGEVIYRHGSNPGSVRLGGQRHPVRVPRVRGLEGEARLESYERLHWAGLTLLRRLPDADFDLFECLKHRRIVVAPEKGRPDLLRDSGMKLVPGKPGRGREGGPGRDRPRLPGHAGDPHRGPQSGPHPPPRGIAPGRLRSGPTHTGGRLSPPRPGPRRPARRGGRVVNTLTRWWEVARREFLVGTRRPANWVLLVLGSRVPRGGRDRMSSRASASRVGGRVPHPRPGPPPLSVCPSRPRASPPRAVTRARWFKSQRKGTSPLFLHTL